MSLRLSLGTTFVDLVGGGGAGIGLGAGRVYALLITLRAFAASRENIARKDLFELLCVQELSKRLMDVCY